MLEQIAKTADEFLHALNEARTVKDLDELRVRYFGRKGGLIPTFFSQLKDVARNRRRKWATRSTSCATASSRRSRKKPSESARKNLRAKNRPMSSTSPSPRACRVSDTC